MSRALPELPQEPSPPGIKPRGLAPVPNPAARSQQWNAWLFRILLVAAFCAITVSLEPFGLHPWSAVGLGALVALCILATEYRLRSSTATALLGGAVGGLIGAVAALLVAIVISGTSEPESTKSLLEYACLLGFGYVGIMLGSQKAAYLKP